MTDIQKNLMACVELGKAVTATLNMDRLLDIVIERLSQLVPAKNWTLFLLDAEKQELRFEVVVGLENTLLSDIRIRVGEGIAGTVAATATPILVPDVSNDPRFSRKIDEMTGFVTRSIICLPLILKEAVIGVIEVVNPENPALFDAENLPVLNILSDFVAIAIANARNHKAMEELTYTDDVTGYRNTRYLHRELEALIQAGYKISLVFLDLDNFKKVVDTHGHLAASNVLGEVAIVIREQLDRSDALVRYGGDEFVVILPDQEKPAARTKVEKIRSAIAAHRFLSSEGLNVRITASFGIANYPEDAARKRELLQLADTSMYRSKADGKNLVTEV